MAQRAQSVAASEISSGPEHCIDVVDPQPQNPLLSAPVIGPGLRQRRRSVAFDPHGARASARRLQPPLVEKGAHSPSCTRATHTRPGPHRAHTDCLAPHVLPQTAAATAAAASTPTAAVAIPHSRRRRRRPRPLLPQPRPSPPIHCVVGPPDPPCRQPRILSFWPETGVAASDNVGGRWGSTPHRAGLRARHLRAPLNIRRCASTLEPRTRPALAPARVHILTPACIVCSCRPPLAVAAAAAVTAAVTAAIPPPPLATGRCCRLVPSRRSRCRRHHRRRQSHRHRCR